MCENMASGQPGQLLLRLVLTSTHFFYPVQFSRLCKESCNIYLEYSTEAVISLRSGIKLNIDILYLFPTYILKCLYGELYTFAKCLK